MHEWFWSLLQYPSAHCEPCVAMTLLGYRRRECFDSQKYEWYFDFTFKKHSSWTAVTRSCEREGSDNAIKIPAVRMLQCTYPSIKSYVHISVCVHSCLCECVCADSFMPPRPLCRLQASCRGLALATRNKGKEKNVVQQWEEDGGNRWLEEINYKRGINGTQEGADWDTLEKTLYSPCICVQSNKRKNAISWPYLLFFSVSLACSRPSHINVIL